jgi:BolA protein
MSNNTAKERSIKVDTGGDNVQELGITSPHDDALMKRKRSGGRVTAIPLNLPMLDDEDTSAANSEESSNRAPVAHAIKSCLTAALSPVFLELTDDSAAHRGHVGAASYKDGESHFVLHVVSASFEGLSRVKRHQLVYTSLVHPELGDLMATRVHALNIKAETPAERGE